MREGKQRPGTEHRASSRGAGASSGARFVRRRLLGAAAASLVGVAVLPATAPAAMAPARTPIQRVALPGSRDVVRICSRSTFTALALRWNQKGSESIHVEVRTASSRRGPWEPAEELHSVPSEAADPVEDPTGSRTGRSSGLLWTGPARCARVDIGTRPRIRIDDVRLFMINSAGPAGVVGPAGRSSRTPDATARPAVVRRSRWGANERLRNCPADYARRLRAGFVHHTAGSNDYSRAQSDDVVRAIYAYHTRVRRWCDIGYNFLIDRFGTVYEGRRGGMSRPVVPAAQQGFNRGAFAAAVMGNFETRRPPWPARRSLQRLLAWRLDVAHLPAGGRSWMTSSGGPHTRYQAGARVRVRVVSGHRRTGRTACPGEELAQLLPRIRQAAARIGGPKILRPRASSRSLVVGSGPVVIRARSSDELDWSISVAREGETVATAADVGLRTRWRWRGLDAAGQPVDPGRYAVTIAATAKDGAAARPARLRLRVRRADAGA